MNILAQKRFECNSNELHTTINQITITNQWESDTCRKYQCYVFSLSLLPDNCILTLFFGTLATLARILQYTRFLDWRFFGVPSLFNPGIAQFHVKMIHVPWETLVSPKGSKWAMKQEAELLEILSPLAWSSFLMMICLEQCNLYGLLLMNHPCMVEVALMRVCMCTSRSFSGVLDTCSCAY